MAEANENNPPASIQAKVLPQPQPKISPSTLLIMASRFPYPPLYTAPILQKKKKAMATSSQSATCTADAQQLQANAEPSHATVNTKYAVTSHQTEWDSDSEALSLKEAHQSDSPKKKTGLRAQWKKLANSQTKPGYGAMGGSF